MKDKNLEIEQLKAQLKIFTDLVSFREGDIANILDDTRESLTIEKKYKNQSKAILWGGVALLVIIIIFCILMINHVQKLNGFFQNARGSELAFLFLTCLAVLVVTALTAGVLYFTNRSFYKELSQATNSGFKKIENVINRNIQSYATIYDGHMEVIECLNNIFEQSIKSDWEKDHEIVYFGAPGFSRFEDEEGKVELLSLEPWTEKKLNDEIQALKAEEKKVIEKKEKEKINKSIREFEIKLNQLRSLSGLLETYSINQRSEKLRITRYINLLNKEELNGRSISVLKKYSEWLSKQSDRIGKKYDLMMAKRAPSWFDSMSYFVTNNQITIVLGEGDLALSINGEYFSRSMKRGLINYLERAFLTENLPMKIKKEFILEKVNEVNGFLSKK